MCVYFVCLFIYLLFFHAKLLFAIAAALCSTDERYNMCVCHTVCVCLYALIHAVFVRVWKSVTE